MSILPPEEAHHIRKWAWKNRDLFEGGDGKWLLIEWDCWGRLFRTVAAFQPGR